MQGLSHRLNPFEKTTDGNEYKIETKSRKSYVAKVQTVVNFKAEDIKDSAPT